MITGGEVLTVIVVVAVAEQLFVPLTVTVYVPAALVVAGVMTGFCKALE
jgi:hypothetical protein